MQKQRIKPDFEHHTVYVDPEGCEDAIGIIAAKALRMKKPGHLRAGL